MRKCTIRNRLKYCDSPTARVELHTDNFCFLGHLKFMWQWTLILWSYGLTLLPCRGRQYVPRTRLQYDQKFLYNKTNRPTNFPEFIFVKKLHMFRAVPLPTISSPLYIRHWYMLHRFDDSFQARSILNLLETCHQTCMTYTSAECTVENTWCWAEELPETCRVSW